MTFPLAYLLHPGMSQALDEAEQNARTEVLEAFPKTRNTALRPEENPNGSLPIPIMRPKVSRDARSQPPALSIPSSLPRVAPTSTPTALTPDVEFRLIEAELKNCQMTREALARREAALRERKAEIVRETKMRLDREVRELASRDKEEEDVDEGLYMRDVQKRVEAKLGKKYGNMNEAMEKKVQEVEEVKEEKGIPISAPERRRLARLALFEKDPRLS